VEFLWADFFLPRISLNAIEHDFHEAVRRAKILALSKEARDLPGYCGRASS
jgi:hypothetical protein